MATSRMSILIASVLLASGIVGMATVPPQAPSDEHHKTHLVEIKERLDHVEEKLDSTTCQLDKIGEKLQSSDALLQAKLETLGLKLEKELKQELKDLTASMTEHLLTNVKLHMLQQREHVEVKVKSEENAGGLVPSQASVYDAISGIKDELRELSLRSDACVQAAEEINERGTNTTLGPVGTSTFEWITILRRMNGRVNFSRGWEDYKMGFGDLGGEFWRGLEEVHQLTSRRRHRLRVILTDYSGEVKFAEFSDFYVHGESQNYRLHVSGYVAGSTAGDSLAYHNGMPFTTYDRDNDKHDKNCAVHSNRNAGWWYKNCDLSRLTGVYVGPGVTDDTGVVWDTAYGDTRSFRGAEMSIREA